MNIELRLFRDVEFYEPSFPDTPIIKNIPESVKTLVKNISLGYGHRINNSDHFRDWLEQQIMRSVQSLPSFRKDIHRRRAG